MPNFKTPKALVSRAIPAFLLSLLVGCSGMEFAPRQGAAWFPRELPAAERAVEAARQAGRDKECPEEFKAAEKMMNDAYAIYLSCHTAEGIAMARDAAARANALCPKKAEAEPPRVPTPAAVNPPPPALTAALSASPASIPEGQCATLTWTTGNASSVSIDQGVGNVDPSGSRKVCPDRTTEYTIAAVREGETRTASTSISVKPKVVDRLTLRVNFDFAKDKVRDADRPALQEAVDFVRKYSGYRISIEGHTDSIGSERYNQGLSERRAAAVKDYLLNHGVTDGARMRTAGHGESQPVADNSTEAGRFENRRVEILILSE